MFTVSDKPWEVLHSYCQFIDSVHQTSVMSHFLRRKFVCRYSEEEKRHMQETLVAEPIKRRPNTLFYIKQTVLITRHVFDFMT